MRSISLWEPHLASPLWGVRALMIHRFFFRFAFAGANVFAWVLVFQYFSLVEQSQAYGLARTSFLYALSQVTTSLATPYSARLLRFGARRIFLTAVIFAASSFVILGATLGDFWGSDYASVAFVLFAVGLGFYRAFYWIPYEIEAQVNDKTRRGLVGEYFIALAPLFAGFCLVATYLGPLWVLYGAAGLMLISAMPIFYLPDIRERFSWGYRETFGHLVDPAHRAVVFPAFLEGMTGAALLLFWPLTIFSITGRSYGMLGIVLSATFMIAIFARSFVRNGLRRIHLHKSTTLHVAFSVAPWALRALVGTPLGAICVDSYFYTTSPRRIGLDPLTFEQTADAGLYVDEYTALKEMALALGRIVVCVVGTLAVLTLSVPAAFILVFVCAAVASAFGVMRLF